MKKKLTVLFAMAVAMMGLVALSGCSKDTSNTDIITMKGDSIKVIDLYNEAKEFPGLPTTTLLQNATFSKIFEKAYGKNVSDKDVADKVASYKTQYGAQFDSMLQQQNMTADSFNAYVRLQLLEQYAIDQNIQNTQMTDANIKAAWNNFHPDVEAYVVMKTTQADATAVKTAATSDASKFEADNANAKQTFDSTSTKIPADVLTAAFKLKNGDVSDVITVADQSTGQSSYYVVKMVKTSDKGNDMNKYKDTLKNFIKTQKESDTSFAQGVIAKYLTDNNVTVKETAFGSIFAAFTSTSGQ